MPPGSAEAGGNCLAQPLLAQQNGSDHLSPPLRDLKTSSDFVVSPLPDVPDATATAGARPWPWRRLVMGAVVTVASLLAGWWCLWGAGDYDEYRGRAVLGPIDCGFVSLTYERHPRLALNRLVVVAHRAKGTEADVRRALAFLSRVLEWRRPFTILYDMREISFPTLSRRQMGIGVEWARGGNVQELLDAELQCIAFVFSSPIIRAAAQVVLHFMRPPQPVHVGKDEAGAFRFARDKCGDRVRDWSAESKQRDEKYGTPKWST